MGDGMGGGFRKWIPVAMGVAVTAALVAVTWRQGDEVRRAGGSLQVFNSDHAGDADAEHRRMWPVFTGAKGLKSDSMVINGHPVLDEEFETTASSAEVLDHYRDQMRARGWRDVTETVFDIDPETQEMAGMKDSVQREAYVRMYEEIVETFLVMQRAGWSVQFSVEEGSEPWRRKVSVYAVETPSLKEFSRGFVDGVAGATAGFRLSDASEASETVGKSRYSTSIEFSRSPVSRVRQWKLAALKRQGWREQTRHGAAAGGGTDSLVILERGLQQGYLAVSPASGGAGASVLFTQVTPLR